MKRVVLATMVAAFVFALSGCGDDNAVFLPTKSTITFAVMSTASPVFPNGTKVALPSTSNGYAYIYMTAALPAFNNVSTTTAPAPDSGQAPGWLNGVTFPVVPYGAKRISPSALVAAGPFANNTSVAKRTKINGYVSTDTVRNVKRVNIFLVYSSPRTPGATIVKGSSVDFAQLTTTFASGSEMSDQLVKEMNKALWNFNVDLLGFPPSMSYNFYILSGPESGAQPTNAIPTISSLLLGF